MAKTTTMMTTMPEGPGKMSMGKEMGMANTEMSKGNMRGACMHYMKAQKMSMTSDAGNLNIQPRCLERRGFFCFANWRPAHFAESAPPTRGESSYIAAPCRARRNPTP